jgi:CRISPR system Cascade subunit CasC
MFVQIHMLQSMPPGNLNRDETGQPKKCLFGGVTRGRISSQCLKRNIRLSPQFKEAFGDALADRTTYLPQMVADVLKQDQKKFGVPEEELNDLMLAIACRFSKLKKEKQEDDSEETEEDNSQEIQDKGNKAGQTGQLVFFQKSFVGQIAKLIADFRKNNERAYNRFLGRTLKPKPAKDEETSLKAEGEQLIKEIAKASESLTVDIGLFGRMTTSDLVVNVEATCQVAHAISTHETIIESDYFTAMDDKKGKYAVSQTEKGGAAFLGSGDTETFYNASVYYKYLNVDLDALKKHLPEMNNHDVAHVAGILVTAASLTNPTGKQNSFASLSVPELILIEVSKTKRPISYANAFLQPVEGPNYMAESAVALGKYVDSVAVAFAPADVQRFLLTTGNAKDPLQSKHTSVDRIDTLAKSIVEIVTTKMTEEKA